MRAFSTSKALIKNTLDLLEIKYYHLWDHFLFRCGTFYGWGRKRSGQKAVELARKCGSSFVLLEDGFIRSLGLGVDGSPSFSLVEDDVGIYYDATAPSRLENLLNSYDFAADQPLMETAREAMGLIRKHQISKYNNAPDMPEGFFPDGKRRVLIVAQTAGDASLAYGMGNRFTTDTMIDAAISENPDAEIWLKIHPDVLSGKKRSDIDIDAARRKCRIIEENVNPISLLEHFDTVYTKTSQMGFEALIMGKKCVCFGMPFYAGWGITDDRVSCERRTRRLSVEEVFAAAYILYTRYYNPYAKRPSDILDTIHEIVKQRWMRGGYDEIIVTLGEVDAAYALWKRIETQKSDLATILDDTVGKYATFIQSLNEYAPVTVISAPLQTIDNCSECSDETSRVRSQIDISIQDRTKTTLEFNRKVRMFCGEQGIKYVDMDPWSIGKDGLVKKWLLNPKNPCDHHYYRWRYALMLILKQVLARRITVT